MALTHSPTSAPPQHSMKATSKDIISLENTPTNSPEEPAGQSTEYDMVEQPLSASISMNIRGVSRLPWGDESSEEWKKAANLTTDYKRIDAKTLSTHTAEPRPDRPPTEPRPLTEEEQVAVNRSVINQVTTRVEFWFKGVKHSSPKYGIVKEQLSYNQHRQLVQHDIRHIMDNVAREEQGVMDKQKAAEFFHKVAKDLLSTEYIIKEHGKAMALDVFQEVLAGWMLQLDIELDTKKFVMFTDVEGIVEKRGTERREIQRRLMWRAAQRMAGP